MSHRHFSSYACRALICCLALCAAACSRHETATTDNSFVSGMAIYYGQHYANKGIETDVWAMEFYSGNVSFNDSTGRYVGTGRILTLTDIFTPPTGNPVFPAGTYTADTTFAAGTLIPGRRESGYDIGAYLTTLIDGNTTYIEYLTDGSMTIEHADSGRVNVVFRFKRTGRDYESSFADTLWTYQSL